MHAGPGTPQACQVRQVNSRSKNGGLGMSEMERRGPCMLGNLFLHVSVLIEHIHMDFSRMQNAFSEVLVVVPSMNLRFFFICYKSAFTFASQGFKKS